MIVARHEPVDLFAFLPSLRIGMEPELAELDPGRKTAAPDGSMRGVRTEPRAYLKLTGAMVLVGSSVVAGKLMAESHPSSWPEA